MYQILSILDINDLKNKNKFIIGFSVFVLIFGIIYEMFSHGVISYYMIFAFLIPLINFLINIIFINSKIKVNKISKNLFSMSICTFTFLSIIKGVLDIYGTTNNLIFVYLIVGIILLVTSIILFIKTEWS